MKKEVSRGYIFVLLTALISGFSIFMNKFGVGGVNPYVFTWAKNLLVAVFLVSLIFMFKESSVLRKLSSRQWGKLALIGLLGGSVPFLLFFKGLSMAPSTTAALLHKSMFVFVAVFAVVFLKERLRKGFLVAAVLLFVGNLFLISNLDFGFGVAEGLILIAVLFWAVETILSKRLLAELPSNIVAFGRMGFGVLFISIFLLLSGNMSAVGKVTLSQLGWILFTAVLLVGYVTTWYAGLKQVSASSATSVLLLGSAVTTLLNFIYTGSVTVSGLIGVVLILSGVIIVYGYSYMVSKLKVSAVSEEKA